MKKVFLFFFLIIANILLAQSNYMDSISTYLPSLSKKQQIEILLKIPYDKIVANTTQSEQLFLDVLTKAQQINNKEAEAEVHNKLALINAFLGNYDKRLNYNLKAIKIYEATNNKSKAGVTYADLAFSMKRRDIKKSIQYMQKGIGLLKEINDEIALNSVYDNYGVVQEIAGNVDSAIYYYNKALDLKRKQNDSIGIPFALGHLSGAYLIKKEYKKSKEYLDESYQIRKRRNDVYGIAECLVLYADFYYAQENYKEALVWFLDCYQMAIKNKYIHLAQYAAEYSSICYEKTGDIQNTVKFLKIQQALKDSLFNETTNKQIAEIETKYETEKKEKQIAEQKVKISEEQLRVKQRNYILLALGLGLLFIIIMSFYIYKQQKFKQLQLIEENRLKDELALVKVQNELHQERIRISRDLHDNIGSQLTFIISSVDNMKYLFKSADEKLNTKLSDVSNFTRTTITQLRDTIWALNKDEISFEDLKSRLFNYIENAQLAQEQTTFNFNANLNSNYQFNPLQGVCIYRIVQEAINNSIKYAAATTINLTISETKESIVLSIVDDGIGFKMAEIQLGNGLENMKNRADGVNAEFAIKSATDKGTEIRLTLLKSTLN